MQISIFYSWQKDSPKETNTDLIEAAARLAAERIKASADVVVEPVIDRDTQDVPGSPAIAQTILEKIDQCSLFLCDVTFVGKSTRRGHSTPNPNVLIELGYAVARKGWEQIICVMNEE